MAGAPKADDLATELGVEDLYEFLGVRSDSTEKEVGHDKITCIDRHQYATDRHEPDQNNRSPCMHDASMVIDYVNIYDIPFMYCGQQLI